MTEQPPFPVPAGLDPAALAAGWTEAADAEVDPAALDRCRDLLIHNQPDEEIRGAS